MDAERLNELRSEINADSIQQYEANVLAMGRTWFRLGWLKIIRWRRRDGTPHRTNMPNVLRVSFGSWMFEISTFTEDKCLRTRRS